MPTKNINLSYQVITIKKKFNAIIFKSDYFFKVLIGGSNGKMQMHTPYDGIITAHSHTDRVLRLKKFPNSDLLISCSWDSTISHF